MDFPIRRQVERKPQARSSKYPWSECEVGDEFIVPKDKEKAVRAAAYSRNKKTGERWGVIDLRDGNVAVHRYE